MQTVPLNLESKEAKLLGLPSPRDRRMLVSALHSKSSQPLLEVTWNSVPAGRLSLYRSCHVHFMALQRSRTSTSSGLVSRSSSKPFVAASVAYRRDLMRHLQAAGESDESAPLRSFIWSVYKSFQIMEIVMLNDAPNTPVLSSLLDWVHLGSADIAATQSGAKEVLDSVIPMRHPDLWKVLIEMAARARLEDFARFISKVVGRDESGALPDIILLKNLISDYPSMHTLKKSESDFMAKWRMFRERVLKCKDRVDTPEMRSLLLILSGDRAELKKYCSSWQEELVFQLFHTVPNVQACQVQEHLQSTSSGDIFDQLQRAILQQDIYEAIKLAGGADIWFVAIFADLIEGVNKLETGAECSLRDYLCINYGSLLMSTGWSDWRIGGDVLSTCGSVGMGILRNMIVHIPFTSDSERVELVQYCTKMGLDEEAKSINIIAGRRCQFERDYANAILLFIEAKEFSFLDQVVEVMMIDFVAGRKQNFTDILSNIKPHVRTHSQLLFLETFANMRVFIESKNWSEAAKEATVLLNSDFTPMKFWPLILLDCLNLMDANVKSKPIFSESDIFDILRCLEDVMLSYRRDEYLAFTAPKYSQAMNAHNQILGDFRHLRMACAQTLAQAFIQDNN